jgi:RNA polymerase sigma-70 factor (ECF subfamily)
MSTLDPAAAAAYILCVEDGMTAGGVTDDDPGSATAAVIAGQTATGRIARSRVDRVAEDSALNAARGGRPDEAVKLLMLAYGDAITSFAIRILRDTESASDVRQQVFLEAFRGLASFRGQSSLWGWLCSIAYHRCMDEVRRSRRFGLAEDVELLDRLGEHAVPELSADQITERRALERCLAKLSPDMRSQLLMRYFLGLSYLEIAEIVGDAEGTVQVRISRILPRLRRCLRGEGVSR